MSKLLVIIPTYDECDNVGPISEAILGIVPDADILFVDDNSPDGTGQILDDLHARDPRINVLHKQGKEGLGRAYLSGFKWGLEREYDMLMEMDADFSHDPNELPNFLRAAEKADLVLGTRYLHGIRITNWPLRRLFLSKSAATYVRLITGLPITDPTGGFKLFKRIVLETMDLENIWSNGYAFQIEMTHKAWSRGFTIGEVPITFEDRRAGYSKMNSDIVREAWFVVWRLLARNKFRRIPMHTKTDAS